MIRLEGKTLSSRRLTYRLLEDGDRPALEGFLRDPAVAEPAGFLPVGDGEAMDAFVAGLILCRASLAILRGDQVIGYISVGKYPPPGPEYEGKSCAELSLVVGAPFQRQGYGAEALAAVGEYVKEIFDHCFVDCFEDNIASRKAILRAGYRPCGEYVMDLTALGGREMKCLRHVR